MKALSLDPLTIEQLGIEQDEFRQVLQMMGNEVMTRNSRCPDSLICTDRQVVVAAIGIECDVTWTSQAPNKFSQLQDLRRPEGAYSRPKIIYRMRMLNVVTFTCQIMI